MASTGGGALVGAGVSALGGLVRPWLPLPVALGALVIVALAYALHELHLWRLPHPERAWQVPNAWIVRRPLLGVVAFGLTLGMGLFTYIPFTSFYLLLAWEALLTSPLLGAALGATYGLARALPVLVGGWVTWRGQPIVPLHTGLMGAQRALHRVTGGLLLLAAALLLVLPLLPH
ncbi:MAG: hypothetical protein M3Z04_00240 [Chloroflexota bacterium]|nr:hypothetical protein [Chloroflexota bacterium]